MKHCLIALLLALISVTAALAQDTAAPTIVLRKAVVLEGPVVHLGDLFDGLGEEAAREIARAPAPGRHVELDARWLAAVARGYGVAWQPTSTLDATTISRASQVVDGERIRAAVLDAMATRGLTGDIEVELDDPSLSLHLPLDAAPSLALTGLRLDRTSGRFSGTVAAPAEGPVLARATVTGRVLRMTEVPVLIRRMVPGEVIGAADIAWRRLRADRIAGNVAVDPSKIIGMSPRRAIRPDEAIRANNLRKPVLVPKNSLVIVRLKTDRMVLTAQGRALQDGASGQVIRVKNTKSNTVINGIVAQAGTVKVLENAATFAASE